MTRLGQKLSAEEIAKRTASYRRLHPDRYQIADACRAAGLKRATVWARMQRGMGLEEAISMPLMTRAESAKLSAKLRTPPEYVQRARIAGVKPGTVRARMKRQRMSLDEAITAPMYLRRPENYLAEVMSAVSLQAVQRRVKRGVDPKLALTARFLRNGSTISINALSKKYNIKRGTVAYRIKNGATLETALTSRIKSPSECATRHNSIRSLSCRYGLPIGALRWRLKKGETLEQALRPRPKSRAQMAREAGLTPSCVTQRINKGMSLKQALSVPVDKYYRNGRFIGSLKDKAQKAGIKYATVRWRIAHGWPKREALSARVRRTVA